MEEEQEEEGYVNGDNYDLILMEHHYFQIYTSLLLYSSNAFQRISYRIRKSKQTRKKQDV